MENMKDCIKLLACLAMVCLLSCSSEKELGREAYVRWVNDPGNKLSNKKEIGEYTFIAEYRPLDFVTLSEFPAGRQQISQAAFDSVKKEFEGMQYFVLKIGTSDASNDMLSFGIAGRQDYYNRIEYFSTAAQHDIYLVDDGDTISCGLYHFERTYGVSPFNNLILGFEKRSDHCTNSRQLHFNDQVLGNGMLIFSFSSQALNTIPQLKL